MLPVILPQAAPADSGFHPLTRQLLDFWSAPLQPAAPATNEIDRAMGTLLDYRASRRVAEDVILTNVLQFDVKIWDPGSPLFEDFHGCGGARGCELPGGAQRLHRPAERNCLSTNRVRRRCRPQLYVSDRPEPDVIQLVFRYDAGYHHKL